MATMGFCGFKPILFQRKSFTCESENSLASPKKPSKAKNEGKGESMKWSVASGDQLILMIEVHKKILVFREIMDLVPLNSSASLHEMVITTVEDLQKLYPWIIPRKKVSKIKDNLIYQGLAYFCQALKSIGESWMNNDCMDTSNYELPLCKNNRNMRHLGETMLATLDCLIKIVNDKFDIMEEDDQQKELGFANNASPLGTPKSVIARPGDSPRSSCTELWSIRKLNPFDLKHSSYQIAPTHIQNLNNKIEEEPTRDVEMDDKGRINVKDTFEVIVFDLDTIEESVRIAGDEGKLDKPRAAKEVELIATHTPLQLQSPKPEETYTLLVQKVPECLPSLPSPPLIATPSMILPNTVLMLRPNVAMPTPQPAHELQQCALTVRIPPPPPQLPSSLGLSSAVVPKPPMFLKGGTDPAPHPPPLMPGGNRGAAPPPPPLGAGRCLRPKATTKLKRSTQLGNLYRTLKGKVEGSSLRGKSSGGRTSAIGATSTGGKQGMTDALAEMTKRSSYFQQIEEDVQKYTKQIIELKTTITNFKTNEMTKLIKFHKDVESILENLTDESQVLSRFEGFPSKKLEALRMAASLHNKLDSVLTVLQNWNIVSPPVVELLDKAECYFNKIKTELDALERTKDEESKKFKAHNIEFDFVILVKIKEAMVDVSSNCMELALQERRNDAANNNNNKRDPSGSNNDRKRKEHANKLLWRAFQFAFQVYSFAGGHDDRADNLTRELAKEIEREPNHP